MGEYLIDCVVERVAGMVGSQVLNNREVQRGELASNAAASSRCVFILSRALGRTMENWGEYAGNLNLSVIKNVSLESIQTPRKRAHLEEACFPVGQRVVPDKQRRGVRRAWAFNLHLRYRRSSVDRSITSPQNWLAEGPAEANRVPKNATAPEYEYQASSVFQFER